MATNNFKAFALDPNANVTSQADWEALPALLSGFTAGKASSAQVNKAIRQASFIAAALAQYTANKSGLDVLDDGDLNGFIAKMSAAFGKDFQARDATLTALAGLATGANKLPYFTGADQVSLADLSAFMRGLLGSAGAAAAKTGLGLGSAADRAVGNTALTQIPDMSFFQSSNNVFRFPNGLIMQAFGVLPSASSTTTSFSFPVAFPNNVIVINANYNTGLGINIYAFNNLTKSGGDMRVYVPNSTTPTTGGGTAAILAVGY